ncbi:Hypothetical protein (Fragment) [Durusdinium trenchii]|uniref:Uncharacterized protein n=1 Tax=Durusdinium trenchii TaxID=1381693 RepID=A0ABP0IP12_9DINO
MIDFLESSEANTVDLQDALFLRPVPWGGWPVPRTSPLCSGLQPPGSNRGSKQFREPTVRAHRKDATGIPTWLGATAKQMLEAIENSGRPIYHSYVAIRNALHFNKEKSCEDSVGLLFDPGLCLENEGGVVYYVNVNPEVKDPLYVRWIGTAWSGRRSQEKPVWEAWPDPILAPPHPYDVVSVSPLAGNCHILSKVLESEKISLASLVYVPINPVVPPPIEVKPNYTLSFLWMRRKIKVSPSFLRMDQAGFSPDAANSQSFRRHFAAQHEP